MMKLPRLAAALLALMVLAAPVSAQLSEADQEQTQQSAVFLLQSSMMVYRDGRHNTMLRALRHLADPQLKPLFEHLAESDHPTLKIHGILGLAECSPDRKIDLVRVAEIKEPVTQAELVGAAMDSGLLTDEQAQQMLSWADADLGVKVMVSTRLVHRKAFNQPAVLEEASKSDNPGRRSMAAVLLLQTGDQAGMRLLRELDQSHEPNRDAIRLMLLDTAMRYEFDRVGPWATAIAAEPGVSSKLGLAGLRTALRFNVAEAVEIWGQQLRSTNDAARQTRLALVALELASRLGPQMIEPLTQSSDSLIAHLGKAARAVAAGDADVEPIIELINLNHTLANKWAVDYARDEAPLPAALEILKALVLAVDLEPRNNVAQRQDTAAAATQVLYEKDIAAAVEFLGSILRDPERSVAMHQAVLLGLIHGKEPALSAALDNAYALTVPGLSHLCLLIRAKLGHSLNQQELADLSLVVRGGGDLPPALRLQAGWLYLKKTGQVESALTRALSH